MTLRLKLSLEVPNEGLCTLVPRRKFGIVVAVLLDLGGDIGLIVGRQAGLRFDRHPRVADQILKTCGADILKAHKLSVRYHVTELAVVHATILMRFLIFEQIDESLTDLRAFFHGGVDAVICTGEVLVLHQDVSEQVDDRRQMLDRGVSQPLEN